MTSKRDMKKIADVKQAVEAELLSRPGVNGVDVGFKYVNGQKTDQIAIRVLVDEKHDVPHDQAIPAEIDGIPTDVIEQKIVLHTLSVPLDEVQIMADSTRYEPLRGGISIGPVRVVNNYVYVGTAGLVVRDNATQAAMLLSNFHVMCIDNGSNVGDQMVQPGRPDGGHAPADLVGTLQRRTLGGQVDAAVSSVSGRQTVCEIQDIGRVTGTAAAALNAPVRKRGRTTGLTHGAVDSINLTITVDYGPGIGPVTLTNQIGIRVDTAQNPQFGDHGDLGSAVVDANNNVIGLYFAGNQAGTFGVANPIVAVLSALDISVCTGVIKPPKTIWKEIIDGKGLRHENKALFKDVKDKRETKENFKNELDKPNVDKSFPDKSPKEIFEGKSLVEGGDPRVPGLPPIEDRLRGLEQVVGQMAHFITSELRPDLDMSALMDESDQVALSRQLQKEAADSKQAKDHKDLEKPRE